MLNTNEKARDQVWCLATIDQCMGDGAQIDIFQLTASRYAPGQACDAQTPFFQHFRNDVGCRLAFAGEIGGQNDFLHQAIVATL
jgi:hypothetical protein